LNIAQNSVMKIYLLLLFLLPISVFSQTISGKIVDSVSTQSIPFATIQHVTGSTVTTDENGMFQLFVNDLPATLIISSEDYVSDTVQVSSSAFQTFYLKLINPDEQVQQLGPVVIAASRRRQSVEEIPISIDVISSDLVKNKGITDLEQAVDQAPGAYTMDGQVSIRGGSGFSYGAGSRVLILWNETPLLSGDAGDTKWNSIPIEQAQQIEVIKGATSVLYGSGALNGIVSLIEREPTTETQFSVKMQTGMYDNPKRETLKWWTKNPTIQQADVTFGKQFNRFGVNLGAAGYTSPGYRQGENEDRARFNGTVYWRPERIEKLKLSLGWNAQIQKTGNFIIWQSDTFAYQPMGGADTSLSTSTLTYNKGSRFSIDPSAKFFDKYGNKHHLKTRYYFVDNANFSNTSQSSRSQVYYGDYQFQRNWKPIKMVLTTGTTFTRNSVDSYLYGDHFSFNAAVYGQLEKKWNKVDVTAGVRAEYFEQDKRQGDSYYYVGKDSTRLPVRPIFRTGVHYQLAKYTHLRASFGQGVRYPSVAERYTSTNVGSLIIFPNPNLQPETGWAAEFGIKQGIKIGNWKGFFDASVFMNTYNNMMEFTLGNYKPDSIPSSINPNDPGYILKWIGFRAENAESAQISGMEYSLSGAGSIGPIAIQTLIGYTYMNPITHNRDSAYLSTFSNDSSYLLKYRFRHLAKADVQLEYKGFSLGGSMRMNSFMVNIDKVFEEGILGQQILPGLQQYRLDHPGVTLVFDARLGYTYKEQYKVAFIVNNVANREYMSRPGDIQPPRTFFVQLSYTL